jgi:hypothetical protein
MDAFEFNRRQILKMGLAGAGCLAIPKLLSANSTPSQSGPLIGSRFVTHVSLVRVNQIEVRRDRSIGEDESADNTEDKVRARRDAFARGCPNGRMTWGLTWLALNDQRQQYRDVRRLLAGYHDRFGDEITFNPGGYFAPMYNNTFSPATRAFTFARDKSGASTPSTTATETAVSAIRTIPAASTISSPHKARAISSIAFVSMGGHATSSLPDATALTADSTAAWEWARSKP